jgi:hypothetical protein
VAVSFRAWGRGLGLAVDGHVGRMKTEDQVGDLVGVGRGAEVFVFVVFQRLDPVGDTAGVVRYVGRPGADLLTC